LLVGKNHFGADVSAGSASERKPEQAFRGEQMGESASIVPGGSQMNITENQLQQAGRKEAVTILAERIIHDLNNTLSSILGFAQLVKMGLSLGANVDEDLDEVLKAGLKARDLVNQIVTFSRQGGVRKTPVEVALLIKAAMKRIRALLPASIEIRFHQGDFKGKILADPVQVQHVLVILCSVVSHAMKEKAGLLEIRLRDMRLDKKHVMRHTGMKPGRYLHMRIGDAGYGMPEDIAAHIFDPVRTSGCGADLFPGLTLVQDTVREMGGAVSACNESENGIVFHILFPEYEMKPDEEANVSIIDY
jgi:two-component system, cell cycle sensor histidine kinase and response regulator CckA